MSTVTLHDNVRSLERFGVNPTVIAGLLQADFALARGRARDCRPHEIHLLKAISELHRAIWALDRHGRSHRTLRSRWTRLAIEFSEFCGLAQNPRDAAEAIERLFWDALLAVEKSVERRPDGALERSRAPVRLDEGDGRR